MMESKTPKGKTVSRSVYQKMAEENKKLKTDLKTLCFFDISAKTMIVRMKWRTHFKKEAEFNSMMKGFATEYLKKHPEYDITNPQTTNRR